MMRLLTTCLVALAFTAALGFSQSGNGEINGTVTDASGAAVGGATITIKNPATGFSRIMKSGDGGNYTAAAMPPGIYSVKAEQQGFQSQSRVGVELQVGQSPSINFVLAVGNVAEVIPTLLNALIGTKFKIVRGYPAANEAMLAMERGEVEGSSSNWLTLKQAKGDWLRDRKVKVILQDLPSRRADLPDTPSLADLGETQEAKQLFGLYASMGSIGRAFFAPPGVPALNTRLLREGFLAMTKDPEFIAEAERMAAEIEIATGQELQQSVEKTLDVPQSVLDRARAIFKQ